MAHRNPNSKGAPKPQKGGRRGTGYNPKTGKTAQQQARSNASSVKNTVKSAVTYFGKATSSNINRGGNTPVVSNVPVKSRHNQNIVDLPWIQNPNKPKGSFFPEEYRFEGNVQTLGSRLNHIVTTSGEHADDTRNRSRDSSLAETSHNESELDVLIPRLTDGRPMTLDPSTSATWSPQQRLEYDPVTGMRRDLIKAAPLIEKIAKEDPDYRFPQSLEDSFSRGRNMERGAYSFDKDDAYFKNLYANNYYKEFLFNFKTSTYELTPVLKLNAQMPEFTGSYDLLGDYYETWTYKKGGNYYRKPGAPEVPYEFDDNGKIIKRNYDFYTVNEDGTWTTYSYTDADLQKLKDDWVIYCALTNASSIEARELTERMQYTAGWNEDETDSFLDISRDALADASKRDYSSLEHGNREGFRSNVGPHTAAHLFKNVGHYLKNYLFTPLSKGDTQTAIMNGLVNLGETCDYAGIGTRALAAPYLGIEYDEKDTALERLAKAYTTHENYDPDTGSTLKDMGIYMLDPSIVTTIGFAALSKMSAKAAAKRAMNPLKERIVKYGDEISEYDAPLWKEYKSISRDIAFADEVTLEKHAARVAEILKDTKYYSNKDAITGEIINDLRDIQNQKSFLICKSLTGASDFTNAIDTFFLAGGLYLPYTAIKTFKATRSILRNNAYIADRLVDKAFSRAQNAQRIYKYYSGGGSILDFNHVIEGFKSLRSLDSTEALKSETAFKLRRTYQAQQLKLENAISRFRSSSASITSRVGLLYDELQRIFKISDTGDSAKTLDELEEHLIQESQKANGINEDCSDILDNMLKTVRKAKATVELAEKNDAQAWLNAVYRASSSAELRDIYTQYLKSNNAHPVGEIESVAVDRYKQLYAKEHNIDKDLVDVPDDMVLVNAAVVNKLESVPLPKSSSDNSAVHSEIVAIPHFLGDAPKATQKAVSNIQDTLKDLAVLDEKGNVVKKKNGASQLVINDYHTGQLFDYLQHVSKDDLSGLVLDELSTKLRKALNELRAHYGADLSALPNPETLKKFLELTDESGDVGEFFIYSGGADLMRKVLDEYDGYEYFMLCRTKESPQMYLPSESYTFRGRYVKDEKIGSRYVGGELEYLDNARYVSSKALREAKLEFEKNKLYEDAYRTAYREMAADPNGVAQRKLKLRHKLENTKIELEDGTVTTAMAEYQKMVHELGKKKENKDAVAGLINKLDIAFDDLENATALTSAQAERIMEVNMAMSTFLDKSLSNPILMDAVNKLDETGPYGFLFEYQDKIAEFLKENIAVGRDTPYVERLLNSIDSVSAWRDALRAYNNFNETITNLGLTPREKTAVLEYVLGRDPSRLREMTRNPGYFYERMEEAINRYLGSDNLLIDNYRETVLRTDFLDESAWKSDHFKDVKECEEQIANVSKSDVKLQMLQAVELGTDAIKRFNQLAETTDVWFIKPVVDGSSPDSAIVRIEMQKWVPVKEDISLSDFLKVLEDDSNSHLFEISEELTEETAIKNVVDILDGCVKSRGIVPSLVTHGKNVFDIDVLRQGCFRNHVNSVSLTNTSALFGNRINTFQELMLQDKGHVCINPDVVPSVSEAVSKLAMDLPDDASYGIFNLSGFSKDLDTLFDTVLGDDLVKEVAAVYDFEHPFVREIMKEQEKIKALGIDDVSEAYMVKDIVSKLKQEFVDDAKLIDELPIEERIREEHWRIDSLPISDEEKELRHSLVDERIRAESVEDLSKIKPDFYGTLDHVSAGLNSIKKAITDLSEASNEAYYALSLGLPTEFSGGVFRDFYDGTFKHIPNVKKIVKELDNVNVPGTELPLSSFLSEELQKDLDSLVNIELDSFGWKLKSDFSEKSTLVNNINACFDLGIKLDDITSRLNIEFDGIKNSVSFVPKLPAKPPIPHKATPWFKSLYQDYHSAKVIEAKELDVLPEAHDLYRELSWAIDGLDILRGGSLKKYGSNPYLLHLEDFDFIKVFAEKYAYNAAIPRAASNNLIVLSKILDNISDFGFKDFNRLASCLISFREDLDIMLTQLARQDTSRTFSDLTFHVESVFDEFNQRAAILQQDLLALQQSVMNRTFRTTLNVTETSPFIRDVFNPILDSKNKAKTSVLCETVKDEVKSLEHIRASQASSCLTSGEFEGFGRYSDYDLPLGTSTELKYDLTGQAFVVKKSYDPDNANRFFSITEPRYTTKIVDAEDRIAVASETAGLLNEARRLSDSIKEIRSIIESHQSELEKLNRVDELISEREELITKFEDEYDTPEGYAEALKEATSKKYREQIIREQGAYNIDAARLKEIEDELAELPEDRWASSNYHENMLARGTRSEKELLQKKQEVMDRLMHNYESLKRADIGDNIFVTKNQERELFADIQKVIEEEKDAYIRVFTSVEDIPAHELMSLGRFSNRARYLLDYKLRDSSFLEKVSTIDDWNKIITQTKQFAAALDSSHPYHYLVYLKEAETIEEAFVVADMLYNMFYKHWDAVKNMGHNTIENGLTHVLSMYQEPVSNIMHSGYDSVKLEFLDNDVVRKILQGDGLDLIYKQHPKSYFDSIYYTSKISDKHSVSANVSAIMATKNTREGWAAKFAPSENTIREQTFAELENSQLAMLEVMDEVAGTPYEASCRMYLDSLQNGLYKAQALQVMDFITKDADHLITQLLYHNGQINIALKYSDDFNVYGKYLADLQKILDENPMYISYKRQGDYLWIGLNKDANPRIINDTKYVKSDTKFELGGKIYDPTELNEHYQHVGFSKDIEITDDMLKDGVSKDKLIEYCERLKNYSEDCYKKLDFLTEGSIRGSSFAPYNLKKHQALIKASPIDWAANTTRKAVTCDQRLFHTSQFDFSIIGENEYRFKLGGLYDDTDILQNIKYCYDDLAGTVSTERMYIANYFDENSHCKFNNIFDESVTNSDVLKVLKANPDQCVLTLTADKNTLTGFRVNKLRITDELSVRQARASEAIVADYETYVEMTRLINSSELDKLWMKAWARMVFFLKVGHLCNPGTWMRNWIDATIKATSATGNIGTTATGQIKAIKYLIEYNKLVKDIRDNYGVHHLNNKRIDNEWKAIQLRTGTTLTKRQFDFLESWLKVSLSGGESRMLQEMLKRQKYDPWRSGNLKPGSSFSSAGRKAMREEFDYLGSYIFRFEQIGDDEIEALIKEGFRKGEEIFVDGFSADEFWHIFNLRKNPDTAIIDDYVQFQKYKQTVENILTIRSNNLFRGNQSLGSKLDHMCSTLLKPMSKVEQVVRLGQFLTLEKDGFTRSEIFKSIADTQFEYELKSSRVKYAELGITYFNFEYNNIRYWCNMLEEQPEFIYVLEQLWNDFSWEAAQEYYENEQFYNNPSMAYMMANGALPIGKSGLYLKMFPSALGALNWFYGMPSQYMTSVVPPVEFLTKEMMYRMGGDYMQLFLSNMDYSYADQKSWEKALGMVPIAGTVYTRYIQHFMDRKPWTRLDEGTLGEALVKFNPTVWGAIYQYNKPHADDFQAFQAKLEQQGKWYDANTGRVVGIEHKNEYGLNDPKFKNSDEYFDEMCALRLLYHNEVWDNNFGGFVKYGEFTSPGKALFDENGNPKDLGLNRYRDLRIPGEWEKLQDEMYEYHGRKWDANTDKFIPFFMWKEEKLNRKDLTFPERQQYMAEKGLYWDSADRTWKSVPESMSISNFNAGYFRRGWHNFRRWVNYGNNPPAVNYNRKRYASSTGFNINGRLFSYNYTNSSDYSTLRMATTGYKTYDEYYKFEYQYNYRYRAPNPLNHLRGYNPIIRYHIPPK